MLTVNENKIIQHNELPEVTNEVSVSLWLNIKMRDISWSCVFHKGGQDLVRTPSLWLTPAKSAPHVRFSLNDNSNAGIDSVGSGLLLNKWYHLAYTLSDPEKRSDFYIDGKWVGFQSIQPTEQIVFNDAPLYIGNDTFYNGITGLISNFRYFNWRLSADEVIKDFSNNSSIISPESPMQPITTTTSDPSTQLKTETNNTAIMAGIGIGSSLVTILLAIAGLYIFKLYRKKQQHGKYGPEVTEESSGHEVISTGKVRSIKKN
ncbi:unnamed protein product [Rhizophagus irregularis]|uniref:Concanavalin A-like lectin/glucanase n=1 Tax=Rhizophagus irregularis TaxID=588596 RepID=A0A2I1FSV0_9GLOM|nr:concanavalin A-like lectin/glucanase [Rhizophagus irregularis]CAB4403903.1 unnamed protein product [Rhizophagus irregularis]